MVKNYFKIAIRNLRKNTIFSFINILGLSIGMAACLLILQYVKFELSFDQFNKNKEEIYRIVNDRFQNGKLIQHGTITYSAIGKALQDDYQEVVGHTKIVPFGELIITFRDKKLSEPNSIAADNSFLKLFTYPVLAGDIKTALLQPYTVIITNSLAHKIFNNEANDFQSVLGRAIVLGTDSIPYKITGIIQDIPENSHLKFDLVCSFQTLIASGYKAADYDFTDSDFWHYIQLRHGTDYKTFEKKLSAFSQRHFQGNKISGSDEKFSLQPLTRAHLYSDFEYEIGKTGSSTVVWGLLIIGIFIILIAWVNYINLTTARSLDRAREVGIRKVAGAKRSQLIGQFLTESLLINLFSLLIAIILVIVFQSSFNQLTKHDLSVLFLFQRDPGNINLTTILLLIILAGVFLSAYYPALVLSSFKPILVLKGKFSSSARGAIFRKALVIGQFAITVALIIGSFVVYRQIRFMNRQELGLNIDQTMIIKPPILTNFDSAFISKENSFKEELKQISDIKGVTASGRIPGDELGRTFNVRRKGSGSEIHFTVRNLNVNYDFIDVYRIKLLAGRNFTPLDHNPDFNKLRNMVLNLKAINLLGFSSPQEAIGKTILTGDREWQVIGVISDFHQKSLRYAIEPTMLIPAYSTYGPISVKINPDKIHNVLRTIKQKFELFFPGNFFDYYFLDEKFNAQYKNDVLFEKVFSLFSLFAILIASLGLLGLSLYATAQRRKEIGIRKVLGATVSSIIYLLSFDFLRLIGIAFLVAAPLAFFIMNKWLQDFAFRISIAWWVFAAAGFLSVIIALATISTQAVKAALSNPVKSLRTE